MTNRRDSFFLWTALAIAATVFAGFWFTYFGPMYEGNRAPSVVVVHLHGWTFFAWYVLLVVQAALAHSRQLSLHRMLGGLSVVLAVLMVGTGLLVVGVRMADALDTGDPFWSASGPAVFATLVLFVGFYAAGLRMRRRPDWHKRLMIVASVGGMVAAVFRLCMVLFGPDSAMWLGLLGSNSFIVAGIAHDRLCDKRVHPAWWIGLSTCVVVEAGVLLLTPTPVGQALSHGLAVIGRTFGFLY
jgi:FtsH-binding integral membrane protein